METPIVGGVEARRVKETEYYDVLGVQPFDSEEQIRDAYWAKIWVMHPSQNRDDPEAAQKYKVLGEAFAVLYDKKQRQAYDENGKAGISRKDCHIHELVGLFLVIIPFYDYIGLAKSSTTQEAIRTYNKPAEVLKTRLNQYVEGDRDGFISNIEAEVSKLCNEENGVNMLNTIGYIYERAAAKELGKKMIYLGIPSVVEYLRMRGHTIKSCVTGTVGLFSFLRDSFYLMLDATKAKSDQEYEQCWEKHKTSIEDSFWNFFGVFIEDVLSHICPLVLQDKSVSKEVLQARAEGLMILGEIFQNVRHGHRNDNMEVAYKPIKESQEAECDSPKFSTPLVLIDDYFMINDKGGAFK